MWFLSVFSQLIATLVMLFSPLAAAVQPQSLQIHPLPSALANRHCITYENDCLTLTPAGLLGNKGIFIQMGESTIRTIKLPVGSSLVPIRGTNKLFMIHGDGSVQFSYDYTKSIVIKGPNRFLGRLSVTLPLHVNAASQVLLTASIQDGWVAWYHQNALTMYNLSTGNSKKLTPPVMATAPSVLAMSADASQLFMATQHGEAFLYDTDTAAAHPITYEVTSRMPQGIVSAYYDTTNRLIINGTDRSYLFGGSNNRKRALVIGDSFSSGEGAGNYWRGSDTTVNKCHASSSAYAYAMFDAESIACSGARMYDVNGQRSKGQYPGTNDDEALITFTPGTMNQLSFVTRYRPNYTYVSIGGNDIGFSQIIKSCLMPLQAGQVHKTCYNSQEDRLELAATIDRLYMPLVLTYLQIAAENPIGRVYVVGYPQIISETGSCGQNVLLDDTERAFAVAVTNRLNAVLRAAAKAVDADYIPTADALKGHKLCDKIPAVNGLTYGNDSVHILGRSWISQDSYHPTAYGQSLIANAVHDYFLRSEADQLYRTNPQATDLQALYTAAKDTFAIGVSKTGRPLLDVYYVDDLVKGILTGSDQFIVSIKNAAVKLMPGSQAKIEIRSEARTLANFTATDDTTEYTITIPPDISSGTHSLHVIGTDIDGHPVDLAQLVMVDNQKEVQPKSPTFSLSIGRASTAPPP